MSTKKLFRTVKDKDSFKVKDIQQQAKTKPTSFSLYLRLSNMEMNVVRVNYGLVAWLVEVGGL